MRAKRPIDWWTLRCNCRWMLHPHGDTRCRIEKPALEWPMKMCSPQKGNCPVWEQLKEKRKTVRRSRCNDSH